MVQPYTILIFLDNNKEVDDMRLVEMSIFKTLTWILHTSAFDTWIDALDCHFMFLS